MHDNAQQPLRLAGKSKASLRAQPLHLPALEPSRPPTVGSVLAPLFGREVLEQAFHTLQHQLQTIGTGVDTFWQTQAVEIEEHGKIMRALKRAEQVLHELREYCFPPELRLSTENLANMVEESVREVAREWERPGRQTRVVCYAPLVALRLDWRQVNKVLERIVACAYAVLPAEGGEVVVETGVRRVGVQQYLDLKVRSCGLAPLAVEEGDVFQPFWQVNGYQFGFSLALVQRMVSRQRGQIFFRKPSARQSCFTLLFRA